MLSEEAILNLEYFKKSQGFKSNGEVITHMVNELRECYQPVPKPSHPDDAPGRGLVATS